MEKIDYLIIILIVILCFSLIFLVSAIKFDNNNQLPDPASNNTINISNNSDQIVDTSTDNSNNNNNNVKKTNGSKYPPKGTLVEVYPDNGLGKIKYKYADGQGGYYYENKYKKNSLHYNVTGEYDFE